MNNKYKQITALFMLAGAITGCGEQSDPYKEPVLIEYATQTEERATSADDTEELTSYTTSISFTNDSVDSSSTPVHDSCGGSRNTQSEASNSDFVLYEELECKPQDLSEIKTPYIDVITDDNGRITSFKLAISDGAKLTEQSNSDSQSTIVEYKPFGISPVGSDNDDMLYPFKVTKDCMKDAILMYENKVIDYAESSKNSVYVVIKPSYPSDSSIMADKFEMEAYSLEDNGEDMSIDVICYNRSKEFIVDYETCETANADSVASNSDTSEELNVGNYILDKTTDVFHVEDCKYLKEKNKKKEIEMFDTYDTLVSDGYTPCKYCLK